MLVRSQSYILLFAMLTKRKTIISKAIFSLFFLLRSVFFLVVRPWIIHLNGFLRKRETRTLIFFFKFIFFLQNVNILQIGLLSVQIDIFRRNSCYFHIRYCWIVFDFVWWFLSLKRLIFTAHSYNFRHVVISYWCLSWF